MTVTILQSLQLFFKNYQLMQLLIMSAIVYSYDTYTKLNIIRKNGHKHGLFDFFYIKIDVIHILHCYLT